jgi:hypothetical protein
MLINNHNAIGRLGYDVSFVKLRPGDAQGRQYRIVVRLRF